MKRAILVNGIPASGKSTVARGIATRLGCPLMTLDTVKDPLFEHFGIGDREHNRKLGRASYAIIFNAIGDWPAPATVVIDAWFGFQPLDVLDRHLDTAGIDHVAEVWCHAPAAVLAARYRARLATRSAGHPGEAYVPELVALAAYAAPTGRAPAFDVDTTGTPPWDALMGWLAETLAAPPERADIAPSISDDPRYGPAEPGGRLGSGGRG